MRSAFSTPEWHSTADAFLQTRGLSLFVMDLVADECLWGSGRCGYCHVSLDSLEPRPLECYGRLPKARDVVACLTCRAGLANCLAPVVVDGRVVAHAAVSGFVSSTRERRRLYEHLIGRDVREEVARLAVRGMPIVTRREIEGYARLAASLAESALVVQSAAGAAADALHEPVSDSGDAVMDAALDVTRALSDPTETSARLLANALALFGGSAGTIAMSRPEGCVAVLASAGEGMPPKGAQLRLEGGAAAKAITSGRTVVVSDGRGSRLGRRGCTLVTPLIVGNTATGAFELRLARSEALEASVVRRIERFARFAALAIAHAERDAANGCALTTALRANDFGTTLGGVTDGDDVVSAVLEELCASFTFDVGGVIVTGMGRDRADLVMEAELAPGEVDMLVGKAANRDLRAHPLDEVARVVRGGPPAGGGKGRPNWALISTPLVGGAQQVGHLFCASASARRFSRADRRLLEGIAAHAGPAIERAALFARVRADQAASVPLAVPTAPTAAREGGVGSGIRA